MYDSATRADFLDADRRNKENFKPEPVDDES
jgi:hypothetical protein